jgi:hypothetical protein
MILNLEGEIENLIDFSTTLYFLSLSLQPFEIASKVLSHFELKLLAQ